MCHFKLETLQFSEEHGTEIVKKSYSLKIKMNCEKASSHVKEKRSIIAVERVREER